MKFYTWDEIFDNALGKGWNDPELKAKDTARWQLGLFAKDLFGIDIEEAEIPEDAIESFLKDHPEYDCFDERGNPILGYPKVCVDLGAVYGHYWKEAHVDDFHDEVDLYFCDDIKRSFQDDTTYYDIKRGDLLLCCDGEECMILEETDSYVILVSVQNIGNYDELKGIDTSFKLSIGEFKTATHEE